MKIKLSIAVKYLIILLMIIVGFSGVKIRK